MIQKLPTRDTYFTDHSKVSRSALFKFKQSKWEYYLEYVAQNAPPRSPSREMELGTIVHTMTLEPHKTGDVCVVAKYDDFRTKAAREWRDEMKDRGVIVLTRDEHSQCVAMADSLRNKFPLLSQDGPVEAQIEWLDRETGVACKCRPDKLVDVDGVTWIPDIKTAKDASPRGFRKSCEDFGYWLQDAHYRAGVECVAGRPARFVFLVVQNSYPFVAAAYELDAESQAKAESRRIELLKELRDMDPNDPNQWLDDWLKPVVNSVSIRDWAF